MSKITNDGLTRSDAECFIAVAYPYGNGGRERVNGRTGWIVTQCGAVQCKWRMILDSR